MGRETRRQGFTLVLLISLSLSSVKAQDLHKIYNIVRHVESNNRVHVVGDGGRAYGVVQIHNICVQDINRLYGTSYTHKQAFNNHTAKEMFILYLKVGVKLFKRRYGRQPSEAEVVRMWNGGIYTGYRKTSTLKYLDKYNEYKLTLNER